MLITTIKSYFSRLLRDLEKAPSGKRVRPWLTLFLPLLILVLITLFVRVTDFDARVQSSIYRAGGNTWSFGEKSLWHFLYHYGTIPVAVVVIGSVLGYLVSWYSPKFRTWRRIFLFNILLGVLAPGVITNVLLKEYWGRPRPREVIETGGRHVFEPVLTLDYSSKGKSFPCGHATSGFYFLGGFFLLRRHRRSLAAGLFWFGAIFGALLGLARMTQGGHYFSDVVYAGAVCYFTAAALYFALGLDRNLFPKSRDRRLPLWGKLTILSVGLATLAGILLASPYQKKRDWYTIEKFSETGPMFFHLITVIGNIEMVPGEKIHITGEAAGHGVPTSKIAEQFVEIDLGEETQVIYKERMSGWFSEIEENLRIELPWHRLSKVNIESGDAKISIDLRDPSEKRSIFLLKGNGEVTLKAGRHAIDFAGDKSKPEPTDLRKGELEKTEDETQLQVVITKEFEGTVTVVE